MTSSRIARILQVEAKPPRPVGALEAEGLHPVAVRNLGGGAAQALAERLADQAGRGDVEEFGEGVIHLQDGQLAVEHRQGHRQGRETQAGQPPVGLGGRSGLGGVQRGHRSSIARSG